MKTFDVYSYGVVSSSTLYRIRGTFPAPEGYAEIEDVRHMTGGEAANSSIVLSRLGARVKLDGNWLGVDEAGRRTKALLTEHRIDTSRLPLREGFEGVREVVFADGRTRTIFGTYGRLLEDGCWNMPEEDDVAQARVICLDPFFREASYRAAELGARASVPVVTVDCRYGDPLLEHASVLVIAESYIRENYAGRQVEDLFREYQHRTEGLVVFTFGGAAIRYARPDEVIRTFQPYPVEAVDTSGGGDAFRAGLVYGLLQGWNDEAMIGFAAAVAALVCSRSPGVMNAPTRDEVTSFMLARKA